MTRTNIYYTKKGHIVLKSNATDGPLLCGSSVNNVYIVLSRKGNVLKCDRTCVNINSNICEHVLAVIEYIDLLLELQKQHSRGVLRKMSSENIISKFTGEHPCWKGISMKLQSNFIEITLRHGCSPVNLLYIFRTLFPQNISGELLLKMVYLIESLYSVTMQSFTFTCFNDFCCGLERVETSPSEGLFLLIMLWVILIKFCPWVANFYSNFLKLKWPLKISLRMHDRIAFMIKQKLEPKMVSSLFLSHNNIQFNISFV